MIILVGYSVYKVFKPLKIKEKSRTDQKIECLKMGSDWAREECYYERNIKSRYAPIYR